MLEVDGSDGGGQLLRSALTLSVLDGEPVEIDHVRGDRSEPGLGAQHLAAVETAAAVADAEVEGAERGSETVSFEPGSVAGGRYEVDIGTAGSLTLLFDTLLPLATAIDGPVSVTATGGTDVSWSPPLAYYRAVKLPLLRQFGLAAAVELDRTGFYPAGGGRATLHLWPSTLSPIDLDEPLEPTAARVYSKAATELADSEVAERQADAATDALRGLGIETVEHRTAYATSTSPGSALVVRLDGAPTATDGVPTGTDDASTDGAGTGPRRPLAGFDAYGAPGKPAEEVGSEVTDRIRRFRRGGAAVDAHMADQLLVFLAVVGGRVAVPGISDHVATSRAVLETFDRPVDVDRSGPVPAITADR
ncbi:RNA 3'-terminal-phosphate cyclase [Halosimplex carlsbadense 2-9-1]|uniref:RNA 3'-terminal phosphate cyclase n=1 Tax=Halosimplex carlsbadense 2-9-1 TaxID=797114 RepID=M0CSK1_9EURY|nr:RNA 3'-terminal phosphate cyclase [Halosimplex carlsbadense]ELZ24854.1 RNA 3'-terminal-phosphate cyclase [Halosimplex carlsbadense 2-9-1]